MSKRFRIRWDNRTKKIRAIVEAITHQEAADLASASLYNRTVALRMTMWNGRDGVFACLDDRTGAEAERFFVEAEDGTGRIKTPPSIPPSMTFEDAKKLKANGNGATVLTAREPNRRGKSHGKRGKKNRGKRRG